MSRHSRGVHIARRVIQAPGHPGEERDGGFYHGGWTGQFIGDHARYNSESFQAAGSFLLSRRTHEIWADYWPTVTDADEIARALNTKPKYVASNRLQRATWRGTTAPGADLLTEVEKLKRNPGKPILMIGSSDLAQTLIEHDLVDEYRLWIHPVVLGSGKRLFRGRQSRGEAEPRLQHHDCNTARAPALRAGQSQSWRNGLSAPASRTASARAGPAAGVAPN